MKYSDSVVLVVFHFIRPSRPYDLYVNVLTA